MTALWSLLLEAQDSPAGVPRTFVEEKKEEMRQARAGDTRAIEERDRRARLDEIRATEREGRGGGRGGISLGVRLFLLCRLCWVFIFVPVRSLFFINCYLNN